MLKINKPLEYPYVSNFIANLAAIYGFNEECEAYYFQEHKKLFKTWDSKNYKYISVTNKLGNGILISAPLYQQLIEWFNSKYKIHLFLVTDLILDDGKYSYRMCIEFTDVVLKNEFGNNSFQQIEIGACDDYYKALNYMFTYAFSLI